MPFLRAEWRKLALANYLVEPEILQPFIPYGTELDLWNNRCYASLVGFMFINTKVLGLKIPWHTNFEEVNLRFYVRRKVDGHWRRGVVFIKEIVPRHAITFVANTLYQEHYHTMPMKHKWEQAQKHLSVEYQWKYHNNWHMLSVKADSIAVEMEEGGEAEFITEHYFGYTRISPNRTTEYEVQHPRWRIYPVLASKIHVDFGQIYGTQFEVLNAARPISVMLAEGSEVAVLSKTNLKS